MMQLGGGKSSIKMKGLNLLTWLN